MTALLLMVVLAQHPLCSNPVYAGRAGPACDAPLAVLDETPVVAEPRPSILPLPAGQTMPRDGVWMTENAAIELDVQLRQRDDEIQRLRKLVKTQPDVNPLAIFVLGAVIGAGAAAGGYVLLRPVLIGP